MTPHRFLLCVVCLCGAALALLAAPAAQAAERIHRYDVLVEIAADGSIAITEEIAIRAEGNNIRRGIYRDFPTRYRDRFGNRVQVDFELLDVRRDGRAEPHFTERVDNGIRINTGDDSLLRVPADYVYTLRYRTTRQLGFFDAHDELYWNAIGTGWMFPIDAARVEVRLPQRVPADVLQLEAYTGRQGAQGRDYRAQATALGVAEFELTRGLAPREGFTVVVGFPKGIVAAPSAGSKIGWFLSDNLGAGLALFGLAGVLLFYVRRWQRLGRDPLPGVIFPRYEPPQGLSPALLRYVWKMGYASRCFAADLVELAVRGLLRIEREKSLLKETWHAQKTAEQVPDDLPPSQRELFAKLFAAGPRVKFEQANHVLLGAAKSAHTKRLKGDAEPRYFVGNHGTTAIGMLLSLAVVGLAFLLSGGHGVAVIIAVGVLLAIVNVVFAYLMYQPSEAGRRLLDEIEGLRQYLSVAEADELKRLAGPQTLPDVDATRYEQLLPYALALDVEDAWTRRFVTAVGAAAAAAAGSSLAWYGGSGRSLGNIGDLGKSLGSSLSSSIASSSSPPGSSSGGGGGGSSGGGGGGGGGGGR
jgi:uncharacterized membrane protein YgcG